jgi:hypothetical protein
MEMNKSNNLKSTMDEKQILKPTRGYERRINEIKKIQEKRQNIIINNEKHEKKL